MFKLQTESFMNYKSLVNCFIWNHQYFEKFATIFFGGMPPRIISSRFMYIHVAPSSDCSLLTLNLPFLKVILIRCEVTFWCLELVWMLHFSKGWWNFIRIHQNYMVLWLWMFDDKKGLFKKGLFNLATANISKDSKDIASKLNEAGKWNDSSLRITTRNVQKFECIMIMVSFHKIVIAKVTPSSTV